VTAGLKAFFLRIAGLVIIISLFVTIGAWIALEPLVITPILRLRKDLVAAGEAISQDRQTPEFYSASVSRNDELGDVIDAFRHMVRRITDAISERKKAEQALKESYEQVASYSRAMNRELEQGREMQLNFLPEELISPPGWESAAFFEPARQVSGDFYDLFELPDGSLGLVIADVCDKGVGAALFMALFRSLIRVFADEVCRAALAGTDPAGGADDGQCLLDQPSACAMSPHVLRPVERTNAYIATHHGDLGMFATLFFGIVDPRTGIITYVNGGHLPLFIIAAGGGIRQRLSTTGPAVGVIADMQFEAGTARVEPGELLFGCTDGVTEASAPDGAFFGFDRLEKILQAPPVSAVQRVDELAEAVLTHTGDNDLFDDITMIAMYRRP
jgi:serine phosphatase RsbU (regulator of sigma subunit)